MTTEDLEQLKKDNDYCIIPIENIVGVQEIWFDGEIGSVRQMNIKATKGEFCQFVKSDYFRTWGKGAYFEENNKPPIEPDLLYRPSNITVEELCKGAMAEIEAVRVKFNECLKKAEEDLGKRK